MEIKFKDSVKNYNLPEGYREYFYEQTGTPEGTLELCCRCYDDWWEKIKELFYDTKNERDPYSMIVFIKATEYGDEIASMCMAAVLAEGYIDTKNCELFHFWGRRFIQTSQSMGCAYYLIYLYKCGIDDPITRCCYRTIIQNGNERDIDIANKANLLLQYDSDDEFEPEGVFMNLSEDSVNDSLQEAKRNKKYENYIYLFGIKKWAGYSITADDRKTCKKFCKQMGAPNVYNILENQNESYDTVPGDEKAIIYACMGIHEGYVWAEFWMAVLYKYIRKYYNNNFVNCYAMTDTIESRPWYSSQWKDCAIFTILKYQAAIQNGFSDLLLDDLQKEYDIVVDFAKKDGTYTDFPQLDVVPSDEEIEKCMFYGKLGSIFKNSKNGKPHPSIILSKLTESRDINELKNALSSVRDDEKLGEYLYISHLLAKQGEKLDFDELKQVCTKAKMPFLANYKTIQAKQIPQVTLTYTGTPKDKEKYLPRLFKLDAMASFDEWNEFWVRMYYEFSAKEMNGCLYPFVDRMFISFGLRTKYPSYTTLNSEKYVLIHCMVETSAHIGDEEAHERFSEILKNHQLQYLAVTGSMLPEMSEQEMSKCIYDAVYFDIDRAKLLQRIKNRAEREGNKYQLTLQLENSTSKNNTFTYNQTVSFEVDSSVSKVALSNMNIKGCWNTINRGLFLDVSNTHTRLYVVGTLLLDSIKHQLDSSIIVDIPYSRFASGEYVLKAKVNSFEHIDKYIVVDVDFVLTVSDEVDDDDDDGAYIGGTISSNWLFGDDSSSDDDDDDITNYDDDDEDDIDWDSLTTYDGECSVFVKFPGKSGYSYNYNGKISVGDSVYVGGKLAGQVGVVERIAPWDYSPYMQMVTEVIKGSSTSKSKGSKTSTSTSITSSSCGDFSIENGVLKKYTGRDAHVVIPNGVTSIGEEAFSCCFDLQSVIIPNSVTSIGDKAFSSCFYLTSVSIPKGVTSIGKYAFWICSRLTSIVIPEGVTSIGDNTFDGCKSLTNITIPDSVTSLGRSAFGGCKSLIDVTIPSSVTHIGSSAFQGCFEITSITIPDGITTLESQIFRVCTSLTSIVLPQSITTISGQAFKECLGLQNIFYKGTKEEFGKIELQNDNAPFRKATKYFYSESAPQKKGNYWHYVDGKPVVWFENATLQTAVASKPKTATSTPKPTPSSSTVTPKTAPQTSTTAETKTSSSSTTRNFVIEDGILKKYRGQAGKVTIPEGVTSIGVLAFNDCKSLSSVSIPSSVRIIDRFAFSGCTGLTSITIPNSVSTIGESAFFQCTNLTNVIFEKGSQLESIGKAAFLSCKRLSSIRIPSGTKSIGDSAFSGCESLIDVTIPPSVKQIGDSAFLLCPWKDSQRTSFTTTTTSGTKGACYVATAVYGSYDCPQVWTLRRYRDEVLGSTWYGRLFIKLYYAISPTLVKWFGKTKWFQKMWKGTLDKMVGKLNDKGFADTPYQDKDWN